MLSREQQFQHLRVVDVRQPLVAAVQMIRDAAVIQAQEVELHIMVLGTDDTTMQAIHAGHRYFSPDIQWGKRFVDILSETEDGNMLLELHKFHDTEPMEPTTDFPYPRAP